jgi:hypothetical protein
MRHTHTCQSLSKCSQNAWAVFEGVSLPQQPTTSNLRVFFFLDVCFFTISSVIQEFFVPFLVEPKNERKLETLDELLYSEEVYGYHPALSLLQDTISYSEFVKFLEQKKLKEECTDVRKCVERMIRKIDIASLLVADYATYVFSEIGTGDVGKVICSFDETLLSAGITVPFKRGNPLLERFDILMRRCLEGGLLEYSGQNSSIELL